MTNPLPARLCLILLMGCAFLLPSGCGKSKKADRKLSYTIGEGVEKIRLDLERPLLANRSLDSLKTLDYQTRLVAFSVDMGKRSGDLNDRLRVMTTLSFQEDNWIEYLQKAAQNENFLEARKKYLDYLAAFHRLVAPPESGFKAHFEFVELAYQTYIENFSLLDNPDQFKDVTSFFDAVILNERKIAQHLRSFEALLLKSPVTKR